MMPPCWPPVPTRLEDWNLPRPMMLDLMLRHIRVQGMATLGSLTASMRLSPGAVHELFQHLRQQQLLEVPGMVGNDYSVRLTTRGREQATVAGELGNYAGPAPVPIGDYQRVTREQSPRLKVTRESLREALSDMVVPDNLLDQIGPALISHRSIFIYGPTGNGKTSLAERFVRVYGDSIVVPHAVYAGAHVINLFDPVLHQPLPVEGEDRDPRWIPCRRPAVSVGGELTAGMLELRLDESAGIYGAPLQMKANNGILIIDDFGRQLLSPRELLNRWIVPLDRRVDYLSLAHGVKLQIPFEVLVVFSTNLDPRDLADEAFLRRIHTKVYVENVSVEAFLHILEGEVARLGTTCDAESAALLTRLCSDRGPLRACYPHDLCEVMASIAAYEERPPAITPAEIERACAIYFTR